MNKYYIQKLKNKGFTSEQIEEEMVRLSIEYPELTEEHLLKLVFENLRYERNYTIILIRI